VTLLYSPLAPRHREGLADSLGVGSGELHVTDPHAPALGAQFALRRNARGIPHYLDRLDQVSIAVLGPSGPVFEDLIPPEATLPGNREYISPPITTMIWPEDMKTVEFFIRKGAHEIRTWKTPELLAPGKNQPLDIRLRQKPAQGWANLLITAPNWEQLRRAPIRLEWSELQVDPRTAEEVLESLLGPPPVVPEPVHYPPEIGLWDGSLRSPGLRTLLQRVEQRQRGSLGALAAALGSAHSRPSPDGRRPMRFYSIGTDGSLPLELDAETIGLFRAVIARIADDLLRRLRRGQGPDNNDALRCLTWCFSECPAAIVQELAAVVRGRPHPWLRPPFAVVVVYQGRFLVGPKAVLATRGRTDVAWTAACLPRADELAPVSSGSKTGHVPLAPWPTRRHRLATDERWAIAAESFPYAGARRSWLRRRGW
jgi:hypothetical protein